MLERRCTKCNTWNGEEPFCKNCGNALSAAEISKIEDAQREEWQASQQKSKLDILYDKARYAKSPIVRALFWFIFSIAFVVFAISSFVAWMVAWTPA